MPKPPSDVKPKKISKRNTTHLHAVRLTPENLEWLSRTISRRLQHADRVNPQDYSKRTKQALLDLDQKLVELMSELPAPSEYALNSPRAEFLIVRELVNNNLKGLRDTILPAYDARGLTGTPRYLEASDLAARLSELSGQLERIYEHSQERRDSDYGNRNRRRSDG
jgi:hypothetical protein